MKHACPKCAHVFEDNAQSKAAKARWKKTTKKQRVAFAKKIRKAGIERKAAQ